MRRHQILEVRTCGSCLQPVVYWAGDFRHLAARCPGDVPLDPQRPAPAGKEGLTGAQRELLKRLREGGPS